MTTNATRKPNGYSAQIGYFQSFQTLLAKIKLNEIIYKNIHVCNEYDAVRDATRDDLPVIPVHNYSLYFDRLI